MRIPILVVLLIVAYSAQSQKIQDPAAKAILEKMKANYDSYKSIEASFQMNIELPGEPIENQLGSIVQAGEKYKVSLDDQDIYCDGETIWVHLKSNKEVQINSVEESDEDMMSPKDLLRIYESEDFEYALVNETKAEQSIEFKPSDPDSEYSKLRLVVNRKDKQMKELKVFSKDGSRYTLVLKSLSSNKTYPSETFVFDTNNREDLYIEDLRID